MGNSKLQIYRGILQYLLESTNLTLRSIADYTDSSRKSLLSIYYDNILPVSFKEEAELVRLYQVILEVRSNKP